MQATVRTYDVETRTGSVLLDNGIELPFDARAFDAGGLRMLRWGQRVNLRLEAGRVTVVTLSTFPLPESPAGDPAE